MKIAIVTNHIAGGWLPSDYDSFLTANEESCLLLAGALKRQGADQVKIYTSLKNGISGAIASSGVSFQPLESFHPFEHNCDVVITNKTKQPWILNTQAKCKIHWSVDIEKSWSTSLLRGLDAFVCISKFQNDKMLWTKASKQLFVSPLGFDLRQFKPESSKEKQNIALYTTSPDRGLETLLDDWDQVKRVHSKIEKLVVTYDINRLQTMGGQRGAEYLQYLIFKAKKHKDIEFTGPLNREAMLKLLHSATLYVHPLNNPNSDLCGYGAQKAILSGCIPVLNLMKNSGFEEFISTYIPYREWLKGNSEQVQNHSVVYAAQTWDRLAKDFWLPLCEGKLSAQ